MAMSLQGGGRGGRRRRGQRRQMMSEINVTPFVDVVLVLLIIFMVAAPMMTMGVPIDLPESSAGAMDTPRTPITVSVTPDGEIYVAEEPVSLDALVETIGSQASGTEDRIYVRGDNTASYGVIMEVMGTLSGAGYSRIGLITDQATPAPAGQ